MSKSSKSHDDFVLTKEAKLKRKLPLKIVQDENRLTINLLDTRKPKKQLLHEIQEPACEKQHVKGANKCWLDTIFKATGERQQHKQNSDQKSSTYNLRTIIAESSLDCTTNHWSHFILPLVEMGEMDRKKSRRLMSQFNKIRDGYLSLRHNNRTTKPARKEALILLNEQQKVF